MAPGIISPTMDLGSHIKKSPVPSISLSRRHDSAATFTSLPVKRPLQPQIRTLILDLGDVLFHYSAHALTALPPAVFGAALKSPSWGEFERGQLTEDECIEAIGTELGLDFDALREGLAQCRSFLHADHDFYEQLKSLKTDMQRNGEFKVYAMTNVDKDDFALLKKVLPDWDLFDAEFTSFEVGMIKPELGFYKHVLEATSIDEPASVIFVDDKLININVARSFGIQGIVFESAAATMRQLRNRLFDPIVRGRQYMKTNARNHVSMVESGIKFRDVFSQFLIHEKLQDTSIISLSPPSASIEEVEEKLARASQEGRIFNYFIEEPVGTTATFPEDVDDTAASLLAFSPPDANEVLGKFLSNRHARDGLVETYWCDKRPGICPVVLTNVIRAFYQYGRGSEVQNELEFVRRILLNGGYIDGSAFYPSPESFLHFVTCLVATNDVPEIQSLREPLVEALRERVGHRGDSFSVAARVLSCQALGVWTGSDLAYLKELQDIDGGWEMGWVCRYGRSKKRIGNRGVVTAYAIRALEQDQVV